MAELGCALCGGFSEQQCKWRSCGEADCSEDPEGGSPGEMTSCSEEFTLGDGPLIVQEHAGEKEEAAFDECVRDQIGHHRGQAERAACGERREHEPGMAHGGEREHALQVMF